MKGADYKLMISKTDVDNIYAAEMHLKSCLRTLPLSRQAAVENRMKREKAKRNPPVIFNSIFTDPEVSSAGL